MDFRWRRPIAPDRLIAVTAATAIWGIAVAIAAGAIVTAVPVIGGKAESIEATTEETAAPAKTAVEPFAAVKTPAAAENATTKTVGVGSANADRGGERERNDGKCHQQLAGHGTLLFAFRI